MSLDLIPRSFWNLPSRLPSMLEDEDWTSFFPSSGLTVSEDDKHVYIEASVPGIDPDKVEVTVDKGILWVRGSQENKEADEGKKYYRKASNSFSYRVAIPGNIDDSGDIDAVCKNGVMKITFNKVEEPQPKKINVRTE